MQGPGHVQHKTLLSWPVPDIEAPDEEKQVDESAQLGTSPKELRVNLSFSNICYQVTGSGGRQANILQNVSGHCHSGKLLAVMGASGAGKSSLLDILAGNLQSGVTGSIQANGQPVTSNALRTLSCYVRQRDVLLATATVREAVTTSAFLRLPQEMLRKEKHARVEAILSELDLTRCADTLVGDDLHGIRGISGGERRRLSVGIGLVTDPRVIFLDEPTSGLDSETATQLIISLVALAKKDRTVVTAIHQPNSNMTSKFDDLLLLAFGRVVYFGPWAASVERFASLGYQCPIYTNPTDFYLMLTRSQPTAQTLSAAFEKSLDACSADVGAEKGVPAGPSGTGGHMQLGTGAAANQCEAVGTEAMLAARHVQLKSPTSFNFQCLVLSQRFCRSWYRDPILMASFVGQYCFAGVFLGLIYLQLGHARSAAIFDRQASLFLVLAVLAFTPSEAACTVWDAERALLRREAASGQYKIGAFFAAKTLVTVPFQILVTTLFCCICYAMIGFQAHLGKFLAFLAICCLVQLISETLGLICAMGTRTSTIGIIYTAAVLLVLLSFDGFLVSEVPVYFEWVTEVSYLCFAYSALYANELEGLPLEVRNSGVLQISPDIATGEAHKTLGPAANRFSSAENICILLGILAGMRLLALVVLKVAVKLNRL